MESGLQPVQQRGSVDNCCGILIASNNVKAHVTAIVALIVVNFVAIVIFTMPAGMSLRASVLGIVSGFFPIGWSVLNVIFLYRLTVEKDAFETLQNAIGGVTTDRRLQLLLITFSFGAFFEGASGFGTPVAVRYCDGWWAYFCLSRVPYSLAGLPGMLGGCNAATG